MQSAGKRVTRQPDWYNPSVNYSSPLLPSIDFDLTMSVDGDGDSSLTQQVPPTLDSLDQRLRSVFDSFATQFDAIAKRLVDFDTRIEELCTRADDNDTDIRTKFAQLRVDVNQDIVNIQNDLSHQQLSCRETQKANTLNHHAVHDTVKALASRVSLAEGQSARLAALENVVRKSVSITAPPTIASHTLSSSQAPANLSQSHSQTSNLQSIPQNTQSRPQPSLNSSYPFTQNSFNHLFTSTTITNSFPTQPAAPVPTSIYSVPQFNSTFSNPPMPVHSNHTLSNISGINLDSTKLPTFNGHLTPIHPEEFLEQAEQYFLTQPPVPDQFKINYVKAKFTDDARLWYHTLLPPPSVYGDFLILFRNHFWSNNQQRAIRNEFYRPYYHNDNASLQKHAMDWINKVRFLQPPIDQPEMVEQILSHYAFHISVALRGLRITTTNELIQQLSHFQQTHSTRNLQQHQSQAHSPQQNSYHQSSGPPRNNQYPQRQNNYSPRSNNDNRPQYNNSQNQPSPTQPDQVTPPSGN